MKIKAKDAFYEELECAKNLILRQEYNLAFFHLERAHILGQAYVIPHSISHLFMLKIYFLKKEYMNSVGQIVRLVLGVFGSAVGLIPVGNTGGSEISMFQKMDIPPDLMKKMK